MAIFLVCGGRTFGHFLPKWSFGTKEEKELYKERSKQYIFILRTLDSLSLKYNLINDENLLPDVEVVHGDALGADNVADDWGVINYTRLKPFKPDIQKYGSPAAFFVRNKEMAEYAKEEAEKGTLVVFVPFPGGNGTKHMVGQIERVNKYLDDQHKIIIEDMRNVYTD